ncbi:UNVERIFIED_CONTAM: hypothetical protein GTU68_021841, partial [Idotea baltica]|nr:hypothetical protein [Idotea baltica]
KSQSTQLAIWQQHLSLRLKEGLLIGAGAFCIYLWMTLLTYSKIDPGWTHVSDIQEIHNSGGRVGAWLADVLFLLLGYFAYIFPLLLVVKTWQIFRTRSEPIEWNGRLFAWRCFGLFLLILAGCALIYMHFPASDYLPASAGGVLGERIGISSVELLNMQGGTLLLVALMLFGLTIYTDLSWFKVMDVVGKSTLELFDWSRNLLHHWWTERAEQKNAPSQLQNTISVKPDVVSNNDHSIQSTRATIQRPQISRIQTSTVFSEQISANDEKMTVDSSQSTTPITTSIVQPLQSTIAQTYATTKNLPSISLLDQVTTAPKQFSAESLEKMSHLLEVRLKEFGVEVKVESVHPGPVITRFEIEPAAGIKVSRISNLAKDLARSLAVLSVRVVEVIPGKTTVGIEVPNEDRQMVLFSEVLSSTDFDESTSPVTLALGHDIGGHPVITNLAKMPHLLVAGTTGSGKSVGVNAMILSILFKSTPEEARLIMIDPKMLELSIYEGIPHLLCPVVTDMKEAANALRWCVAEMERRYKLMASMGVRNLASFNRKVTDAIASGSPLADPLYRRENIDDIAPLLETLPTIVVVVDEFADMMMIVGKKVEELIARIAQKARAAGIHLILATQRPSVDVITGLIKANIPTRMAFQVSSKIDSRTILDQGGAEQLLGHGDMLYLPPGTGL